MQAGSDADKRNVNAVGGGSAHDSGDGHWFRCGLWACFIQPLPPEFGAFRSESCNLRTQLLDLYRDGGLFRADASMVRFARMIFRKAASTMRRNAGDFSASAE